MQTNADATRLWHLLFAQGGLPPLLLLRHLHVSLLDHVSHLDHDEIPPLPYIPRPSAYACDYHLTYQPRPPPSIPERDVGEFSRRGSKLMMCTIMRPDCAGICAILIVWLV